MVSTISILDVTAILGYSDIQLVSRKGTRYQEERSSIFSVGLDDATKNATLAANLRWHRTSTGMVGAISLSNKIADGIQKVRVFTTRSHVGAGSTYLVGAHT